MLFRHKKRDDNGDNNDAAGEKTNRHAVWTWLFPCHCIAEECASHFSSRHIRELWNAILDSIAFESFNCAGICCGAIKLNGTTTMLVVLPWPSLDVIECYRKDAGCAHHIRLALNKRQILKKKEKEREREKKDASFDLWFDFNCHILWPLQCCTVHVQVHLAHIYIWKWMLNSLFSSHCWALCAKYASPLRSKTIKINFETEYLQWNSIENGD